MSLETRKMELRSSLKACNFRKDRVAVEIAKLLGINGWFISDDLDLSNPIIPSSLVSDLKKYDEKVYRIGWELEKLEYIDEPERYAARRDVYEFISLLSLDESIVFLQRCGCRSTIDLVEKVIKNPHLIEEVVLNE